MDGLVSYDEVMSKAAKRHRVVFALYDGVLLLDVAGPAEVLAEANRQLGRTFYALHYVSSTAGARVQTSVGLPLQADPVREAPKTIDTLILPGGCKQARAAALNDARFMAWLRKASKRARRTASVCSGAFFSGALGLLDGREATTHWAAVEELRERHPDTHVAEDALYVEDGKHWSSAGVLSGVDMSLAIVSRDLGSALALRVARQLVVFMVRHGGQSQFSGVMDLQTRAAGGEMLDLLAWLENDSEGAISVEAMAARMKMSVRTLHRRCHETFAMSPARLLRTVRLERARELLHDTQLELKVIAGTAGFASPEAFSKAFRERFGTSPGRYRESFGVAR